MRVLALEREIPGTPAEAFAPLLREEAARLWELQQAGVVRDASFRADRDEAVLLLECADLAEARAALGTLPLVRAGLIEFELIPLRAYTGYARLFRSASGGAAR